MIREVFKERDTDLNFGKHKIEDISDEFMPPFIKLNIWFIEKIVKVRSKDEIKMAIKLKTKIIVTLLSNGVNRYFSTELFGWRWLNGSKNI